MEVGQVRHPSSLRLFAVYAVMILGSIFGFLYISTAGAKLSAPAPASGSTNFGATIGAGHSNVMMHLLLAQLVIVTFCRLTGRIFWALGQPAVIGEVVAGILLGPSLLGRVAPDAMAYLLPTAVMPALAAIAQIGVMFFMFTVGLELEPDLLKGQNHAAVATSHASIIAPFLLGAGLSLWLYPRLSTSDVPFLVFGMFMGLAVSVTAFPILARILTDLGVSRSPLGVYVLTCAAVDDVTAWCLLAVVVGIAQAEVGGAVFVVLGALVYIGLMLLASRPLKRFLARLDERGTVPREAVALVMCGLLLSSWVTEALGIHAIFGAFMWGVIIPSDSITALRIGRSLRDVVSILFLPAFFAYTGMRTKIGLVSTLDQWLITGAIIAVATAGKFGGSFFASRLSGSTWRDSTVVGVLMNTRGLMELIVLNIALDLKIISETLFAMMVLMALATTFATTPILRVLYARRPEVSSGAVVFGRPAPSMIEPPNPDTNPR